MTSGYQCPRCGTQHGFQLKVTSQRQIDRCLAGECPVTVRAVMWRAFGRRWPPSHGQPTVWQRVRAVFWPEVVSEEGFRPPSFYPIKGPMGLCRGSRHGQHLAARNLGRSIGLAEFDEAGKMSKIPADAWVCDNCQCGWQEVC